jgi:DNA repair protein RecO (recombination protein O)
MAYKDRNCFVLKSTNYRDADKIFTLYSDKDGKISAIARGVRKLSSKRSGSLDRLNLVKLSYYQSPSGHKTITEVSNISSFRAIKKSPELINTSYRLIELLLKKVEEDSPDEDLFTLIERSFSMLNDGEVSAKAVYAHFLLNFMDILGYKLSLESCVSCKRPLSKDWGTSGFNYDLGGLVCSECKSFEQILDLKAAALMSKAKNMNRRDHRFYKNGSKYLNQLVAVLQQYVDFKLTN